MRFAEVDLDEDEDMESPDENIVGSDEEEEEEEEEGDDEDFIDLLDVLDGKGEIDMSSEDDNDSTKKTPLPPHQGGDDGTNHERTEDEDEDESEEEGNDEDEEMAFLPSDEEDIPEALDQLNDFVSGLDVSAKKRKAPEEDTPGVSNADRARKRRLLKEKTEAGDENEFRVQSNGMWAQPSSLPKSHHLLGSKLNLEDLLAPLASSSSTLQSLKKSTKVLAPSSSSRAKTLSAPPPQRTQERLDRQAAYEQTKEEVDKWSDTMKRIREVHTLCRSMITMSSLTFCNAGGTLELPSPRPVNGPRLQP